MENDKLSSSLEDYLEAIYTLCTEKQVAHANQIAMMLNVGKSSVSWALNQLKQKQLINYVPYESITLTDKGLAIAEPLARSHAQIKNFLTEILGMPIADADSNACRMEHVVDHEVLERMDRFVAFMDTCPNAKADIKHGFTSFIENDGCGKCGKPCKGAEIKNESDEEFDDKPLPKVTKERDILLISRLAELFDDAGMEFTDQQQAIVDAFMSTERHQTVDALHKQLKKQGFSVTLTVIDETLKMLCEHKIARMIDFNGVLVYEHLHPESHHDHLFCVKCGSIIEFFDPEIERLQAENAKKANFRLIMHSMNLYGVCKDCLIQEKHIRTISDCLAGETVKIVRIVADDKVKAKLADMGLMAGNVINVLGDADSQGGNFIVVAHGSRLTLDGDTARMIRVSPIENAVCSQGQRRRRHMHKADRWPFGGRFRRQKK
ncbi:MAG: transcriptional repressor [Phycisphaerae bacterium]|nr:transcriptional repressor [Phycisphaerae bacterium]